MLEPVAVRRRPNRLGALNALHESQAEQERLNGALAHQVGPPFCEPGPVIGCGLPIPAKSLGGTDADAMVRNPRVCVGYKFQGGPAYGAVEWRASHIEIM
jgi:hypothetical protein